MNVLSRAAAPRAPPAPRQARRRDGGDVPRAGRRRAPPWRDRRGRGVVPRDRRHRRVNSSQLHRLLAPARTRRPSARKALAHDRLRFPLRLALAQPPALRIPARDRHARAGDWIDRRGVFARQRIVPAPVPLPRARASGLHQRDRAEVEPRDDRHQLPRLRAVAARSEGLRGDRALRPARVQSRDRRAARIAWTAPRSRWIS